MNIFSQLAFRRSLFVAKERTANQRTMRNGSENRALFATAVIQ
jgi:hypothetical protein